MASAWYVYPMHHTVSFTVIARHHVRELRRFIRVEEIDEHGFPNIVPYSMPLVIVHPWLWIVGKSIDRLRSLRPRYGALIAVDVADSDRLSSPAANLINFADAAIVPSMWCADAYRRSGVVVPVHVVPHGVSEEFMRPKREPRNPKLKQILQLKREKNLKLALFFLWHSGYRKGADLVYEAMRRVQEKRRDVALLVKISNIYDPHLSQLSKLKAIVVEGWLPESDLVDLYDLADVCLVFSRGGGFELNALEALARGVPTLVPEIGPWTEYAPSWCYVPVARMVKVFPASDPAHNYHAGCGPEVDVEEAAKKIIEVVDHIDEYRQLAARHAAHLRREYTWKRVGEKLLSVISEYM